jgi:hypothetical protein
MRSTLHLVPEEDAGWMRSLLAPRGAAMSRRRLGQLGFSEADADRAVGLVREEIPCTRADVAAALERHGLPCTGQAPVHVLFRAAAQGVIVLGLDDRVLPAPTPGPAPADPAAELAGGLARERQDQDPPRIGAFVEQAPNARDDRARLAASRAGHDEERPRRRRRDVLHLVEAGQCVHRIDATAPSGPYDQRASGSTLKFDQAEGARRDSHRRNAKRERGPTNRQHLPLEVVAPTRDHLSPPPSRNREEGRVTNVNTTQELVHPVGAMLVVVKIGDEYGVIVSEDATDPERATLLSTFATEDDARRCASWLVLLRKSYHGALPAYL